MRPKTILQAFPTCAGDGVRTFLEARYGLTNVRQSAKTPVPPRPSTPAR